jgi:Spy/CpxP family protein refolding chaperone
MKEKNAVPPQEAEKQMNIIRNLSLAAVTVLVSGAVALSAQAPDNAPGLEPHRPPMERAMGGLGGPHGDHGRWWNEPHAVEKLKLTDSQRKAMDDIYQQHRLTLVDLHGALEKEELTMEPLIRAEQPDENKILAQIDKVAQARAELEKANARMLLDIRQQLTPEQWKTLQADRAARHEGPGGNARPQWRRPGGPGSPGGPGGNAAPAPGTAPAGPGMGMDFDQ